MPKRFGGVAAVSLAVVFACGGGQSESGSVGPQSQISISIQPESATVATGGTLTFTAAVTGAADSSVAAFGREHRCQSTEACDATAGARWRNAVIFFRRAPSCRPSSHDWGGCRLGKQTGRRRGHCECAGHCDASKWEVNRPKERRSRESPADSGGCAAGSSLYCPRIEGVEGMGGGPGHCQLWRLVRSVRGATCKRAPPAKAYLCLAMAASIAACTAAKVNGFMSSASA
jgi:hypothetical protein